MSVDDLRRPHAPFEDGDADIAAIGALVADRARCRMLLTLLDGSSRSATELASAARVSPATASSHLAKLTEARLLSVEVDGRHRFYRIARPEVGALIDALEYFADSTDDGPGDPPEPGRTRP